MIADTNFHFLISQIERAMKFRCDYLNSENNTNEGGYEKTVKTTM